METLVERGGQGGLHETGFNDRHFNACMIFVLVNRQTWGEVSDFTLDLLPESTAAEYPCTATQAIANCCSRWAAQSQTTKTEKKVSRRTRGLGGLA